MSLSATPYVGTVHYIERRVYPYQSWEREYFFDGDLAKKVARFYLEHMGEVPGGIDTQSGSLETEIVNTPSGPRLNEIRPGGAIHMITTNFDLVERAKSIITLGEWVKMKMEVRG